MLIAALSAGSTLAWIAGGGLWFLMGTFSRSRRVGGIRFARVGPWQVSWCRPRVKVAITDPDQLWLG